MKISWFNRLSIIKTTFLDGTELEWPSGIWSRTANVDETMFDPVNDYLASINPELIKEVEDIYLDIHESFDMSMTIMEQRKFISAELQKVFQLIFKWDEVREWSVRNGGFCTDGTAKEQLGELETDAKTYFSQDTFDLMVMSLILKALMPVIAIYCTENNTLLSKDRLPIEAIRVLSFPEFSTSPAITKLIRYITAIAETHLATKDFIVKSDISSDEIIEYLFSLSLIKKVSVFMLRNQGSSVISMVYQHIFQTCNDLKRKRPNQKLSSNDQGEEQHITDMYKKIQPVPIGTKAVMEEYALEKERVIHDIDPTIKVHEYELLEFEGIPLESHFQIAALVVNDVFNCRLLDMINKDALFSIFSVTGVVLSHWGFNDLAILFTRRFDRQDPNRMSIGSTNGFSIGRLDPERKNRIVNLYPKFSNLQNPGLTAIETVVTDIQGHEWFGVTEDLNNLRNSVADLILKLGEE